MASIRSTNTKPEMLLRHALHAKGFRYRLHASGLPGHPDLVFSRFSAVIFVNGCFWHKHDCRYGSVTPATRAEFWAEKRAATVARDAKKTAQLEALGWRVHTVWECELRDLQTAAETAVSFLEEK